MHNLTPPSSICPFTQVTVVCYQDGGGGGGVTEGVIELLWEGGGVFFGIFLSVDLLKRTSSYLERQGSHLSRTLSSAGIAQLGER